MPDARTDTELLLASRTEPSAFVEVYRRHSEEVLRYVAGRVLDPVEIRTLSEWATEGLLPDLTVLLDLDPAIARGRLDEARTRYDRLEAEASEFHDRVRRGYLGLAHEAAERFVVVDATRPVDEIAAAIRERVAALL